MANFYSELWLKFTPLFGFYIFISDKSLPKKGLKLGQQGGILLALVFLERGEVGFRGFQVAVA